MELVKCIACIRKTGALYVIISYRFSDFEAFPHGATMKEDDLSPSPVPHSQQDKPPLSEVTETEAIAYIPVSRNVTSGASAAR